MSVFEEVAREIPGLLRCEPTSGTELTVNRTGVRAVEVTATAGHGLPGLVIEVDLAAAAGYWHPGTRVSRHLPPDWMPPVHTSLVESAPVGALFDAAGTVQLGWAANEAVAELAVRYGVSEERKSFVVDVRPTRPLDGDLVIRLDARGLDLALTVSDLAQWLSLWCAGDVLRPPDLAREPVYSTWYTFTQDINDAVVLPEAQAAADIGCGSVFLDDGWQRLGHGRGYQGCGDWVPDPDKFADLTVTVKSIQNLGVGVALWVAPLLLGEQSGTYPQLAELAPHWEPTLCSFVLDPRHPAVRDFVAQTCVRLVKDYGVDLLKIDFLEQAMVYQGTPTVGDLSDVGDAMAQMLGQTRRQLAEAGHPQVVFEFRQPYVNPAVARFGQILRANDCPGDSVVNRRSVVDARLLAVGQVVHADPMMWGAGGGVEAVAQQLYGGWFGVPQISMRLTDLDPQQAEALRGLLALWRAESEVILDGVLLAAGADSGFDEVTAVHADLDRSVVVRYSPRIVELDPQTTSSVLIVNATAGESVIIDTARPVASAVVRSASAQVLSTTPAIGAGLVRVWVPAFGSVDVTLS